MSVSIRSRSSAIMAAGRGADPPRSAAVKLFSAGTAGCVADLVTFPLDTAKVRLQVRVTWKQVNKHAPILTGRHIQTDPLAEIAFLKIFL